MVKAVWNLHKNEEKTEDEAIAEFGELENPSSTRFCSPCCFGKQSIIATDAIPEKIHAFSIKIMKRVQI